ncbi:MAG: PEP-CTERM sorting domain-containing protein [candidate division Zixibacteria bacterium]|nr:PEP-CTERM sorting domain-containing protein [candidate division Zixibacteria bacterium]
MKKGVFLFIMLFVCFDYSYALGYFDVSYSNLEKIDIHSYTMSIDISTDILELVPPRSDFPDSDFPADVYEYVFQQYTFESFMLEPISPDISNNYGYSSDGWEYDWWYDGYVLGSLGTSFEYRFDYFGTDDFLSFNYGASFSQGYLAVGPYGPGGPGGDNRGYCGEGMEFDGNLDVSLNAVVPEPASIVLFGLGIAGFGIVRRFKKKIIPKQIRP